MADDNVFQFPVRAQAELELVTALKELTYSFSGRITIATGLGLFRNRTERNPAGAIMSLGSEVAMEEPKIEWTFARYRNGVLMAEGAKVHAATEQEALQKAKAMFDDEPLYTVTTFKLKAVNQSGGRDGRLFRREDGRPFHD